MVRLRLVLIAVVLGVATAWGQTPLGTAFVYQGRLTDGGTPATGTYDFRMRLFDAASGGTLVGSPNTLYREDVAVESGIFTVSLDFGATAFGASKRWLEIAVRPGASTGNYTVLGPRQELTPAPTAIVASSLAGVLPVASGGTGSSSQNFVDLTTTQTVGGTKTFAMAPVFAAAAAPFAVASTGLVANLNADLLDGNHASAFQRRYQNVRVVAKSGGDYTDPVAAMNDVSSWCPSPTSEARCLLRIMPGTYDIGTSPLQMRAYVDIEGSGMSSTVIKGATNANTARAIVSLNNASTRMDDVRAFASGPGSSYGVVCDRSMATINDVEVLVGGSGTNYGVFLMSNNDAYRADITRLRVFVNPSSGGFNFGMFVGGVPTTVHEARIIVGQGAPYSFGVQHGDGASAGLELRDVVVRVTGSDSGFGVFNVSTGGNVTLDHSDIQTPTNSVRNDNAAKTFQVGNSKLAGLAWGTVKCVFSYNDAYNPLNSACVP